MVAVIRWLVAVFTSVKHTKLSFVMMERKKSAP